MIIFLFLIFVSSVSAILPGGAPCALHSQCSSGKCYTYCCNSPFPNCAYCWGDGKCGGCDEGWELNMYDNKCYQSHSNGALCTTNEFCSSKICKEKCCSKDHPHCLECTTYGYCAQCEKGYYLDPDARLCLKQREVGDLCERFILHQCTSLCKTHCCDLTKLDPNCDECDEEGKCQGCKYGYKWADGVCVASSLRAGSKCNQDSMCEIGKCIGGYCCNQPGCLSCSMYGTCTKCKEGFFITDGFCRPLKYFSCAKRWNMVQKRFCDRPKRLNERCCWMCEEPCKFGMKCEAISDRKGVCVEDFS